MASAADSIVFPRPLPDGDADPAGAGRRRRRPGSAAWHTPCMILAAIVLPALFGPMNTLILSLWMIPSLIGPTFARAILSYSNAAGRMWAYNRVAAARELGAGSGADPAHARTPSRSARSGAAIRRAGEGASVGQGSGKEGRVRWRA